MCVQVFARFEADLEKFLAAPQMIDQYSTARGNWDRSSAKQSELKPLPKLRQIVLVSPIAHENLHAPQLPDGEVNNRNLALYTAAMRRVAAKHGVVAMSHTINQEECVNGIRSTVVCPGEVATPILDKRPVPITPAERKRMAQSEDVGDLIRYVATLPAHICINEVWITPTWNRGYVASLNRGKS